MPFPNIDFVPYALVVGDDDEIVTKTAGMASSLNALQGNIATFGAQMDAAIAAVQASNGSFYQGVTSTSSFAVGVGSKTFVVADKKAFVVGNRVRVVNTSATWMEGDITAATATSITINVDTVAGSGTLAVWALALTGAKGATGSTGATGATGAGYDGVTSTASVAIVSTGNVTLTINKQGAYVLNQRVRIGNSAVNWMEGDITAISASSMTVTIDKSSGSGTLASWTIGIAGEPGAAGRGVPAGGAAGQVLKKLNNTDYAAVWGDAASAAVEQVIRKTIVDSNFTITLADVTEMVGSLAAGDYKVSILVPHTSAAATTGLKLGVGGTAAYTVVGTAYFQTTAVGASLMFGLQSRGTAPVSTGTAGTTAVMMAEMVLMLKCVTAGTFTLQFASEVAGSGVNVLAGSTMIITPLTPSNAIPPVPVLPSNWTFTTLNTASGTGDTGTQSYSSGGLADGDFTTTHWTSSATAGSYIRMTLPALTFVDYVELAPMTAAAYLDGALLQYSYDNTTWFDILAVSGSVLNQWKSYRVGVECSYLRLYRGSAVALAVSGFRIS